MRYVEMKGVSDRWDVGRIVTRGRRTILYPPDQRLSCRRGGPVHVGITIRPGDVAQSVLRAAIAAFPYYLGSYGPDDLILEVQVEEDNR